MLGTIIKLIELVLRLFDLGTKLFYKSKRLKREKAVETIKSKESSKEDKLKSLSDLER